MHHYGAGVGDDSPSWGADWGRRKLWDSENNNRWHSLPPPGIQPNGRTMEYFVEGDVICFAANQQVGKIAVAKFRPGKDDGWTGGWTDPGMGVVFVDEKIKEGVMPAITFRGSLFEYAVAKEDWKHGPPPPDDAVWDK